ncbi:MAG: zf-HC2 domain-containing protein [Acidimicrobiia bacterium]
MSHRPELLSALLDGELSEVEAAWVAEHLDGCGICMAELHDLSSARAAVRSLPLLDLPERIVPHPDRVVRLWPRRAAVAVTSVAAAAAISVGALGMFGMAAETATSVDVTEAEAILVATESLGLAADGSPAGEYLTSGSGAHYRARQTTACKADQTLDDRTVDVTTIGGVTVMSDPLAQLTVVLDGSVATGPASGPIETVTVTGPAPQLANYVVSAVSTDEFRDRAVDVVTLARDGVDRANLWIDVETGVIVYRELLGADGGVACVSELVEFEPIDVRIQASIPFDIRAEVRESVYEPAASEFVHSLGGLDLVATYRIEGGEAGIYSDGLFTIAVVRVEGGQPDTAGQATSVVWESDGVSWAIVGSLPDDLFDQVRQELPAPAELNPFAEGWRILFG